MKNKNAIIAFLRSQKTFLNSNFGVLSIGLFGSYARGSENELSDIDVIVELKEPRFDWMAGLKIFLESKLEMKVDLVRKRNGVKSYTMKAIEKEAIYA